jgi:outer membrane protein assembly factor BamE (lipoprotein component of BamABCDE complex)
MSKSLIVVTFMLVVMLGGCATGNTSIANESTLTLSQKLVKGKTTKADVSKNFGEPSERGMNDGKEYWAYQMAQSSAKTFIPFASLVSGSSGINGKYLRIFFDKKGMVDSYELSDTKI